MHGVAIEGQRVDLKQSPPTTMPVSKRLVDVGPGVGVTCAGAARQRDDDGKHTRRLVRCALTRDRVGEP